MEQTGGRHLVHHAGDPAKMSRRTPTRHSLIELHNLWNPSIRLCRVLSYRKTRQTEMSSRVLLFCFYLSLFINSKPPALGE